MGENNLSIKNGKVYMVLDGKEVEVETGVDWGEVGLPEESKPQKPYFGDCILNCVNGNNIHIK